MKKGPGDRNPKKKTKQTPFMDEPLEVLKTARRQVTGEEFQPQAKEPQNPELGEEKVQEIQEKDLNRIKALEAEMKEIRELKKKQEEEDKIQEEAQAQQEAQQSSVPEVSSKRSRRFLGFGQKTAVKRQQTRVEKPLPPTG